MPPAIRIVNKISSDECSVETIDIGEVDDRFETRTVVIFSGGRFFNGSQCFAEPVDVIVVKGLSAKEKECVLLDSR